MAADVASYFLRACAFRSLGREDCPTEIATQLLQFIHRRLKRRSADHTYQRSRFHVPRVEFAFRTFWTAVPVLEPVVRDPHLVCTFVSAGSVPAMPIRLFLRCGLALRRLLIRIFRCVLLCRRLRLRISEHIACLLTRGSLKNPPQFGNVVCFSSASSLK